MRDKLKHLFRLRCRKWLANGPMVYGLRGADTMNPDGTFNDGVRIEVFGSITCARRRFHFGEHRPPKMKPCVPVECPPIEEVEVIGTWASHD